MTENRAKDELKKTTINALSWSFLESAGVQAIKFVIGVLLARLLFPEQFGLIGMLAIFIAVAQTFFDSGFGAALIQKRELTDADTSSIFYFNIAVGMVSAGSLCLLAPWIAAFYKEPLLTPLTRVLSLTIVINAFGLIQSSILTREINFKFQANVSLAASIVSGIIAVTMAVNGYGVWSLVVQQVASALISTTCLWIFNSWRPTLIFSIESLCSMFGYGSRLLASGLLNQIFENIYYLVIGKLYSAADLGFFTRGKTMQEIPANTLSMVTYRVTFPIFSGIQDDLTRLKRGLNKALTFLVFLNFPMMVGMAILAHPLVLLILTDKWSASIPYLQLFCVAGMLLPLHAMNLNILQAVGRSDLFLRLEIIKKVMIVINIAITWRWGISAMIYGIIIISCISCYLNSYYTGRLIGYPIRKQLQDVASYFIMSMLMGIAVYALGFLPYPNLWTMVVLQIIAGIVVYAFLCRLFRLSAFMELYNQFGIRRHM